MNDSKLIAWVVACCCCIVITLAVVLPIVLEHANRWMFACGGNYVELRMDKELTFFLGEYEIYHGNQNLFNIQQDWDSTFSFRDEQNQGRGMDLECKNPGICVIVSSSYPSYHVHHENGNRTSLDWTLLGYEATIPNQVDTLVTEIDISNFIGKYPFRFEGETIGHIQELTSMLLPSYNICIRTSEFNTNILKASVLLSTVVANAIENQ